MVEQEGKWKGDTKKQIQPDKGKPRQMSTGELPNRDNVRERTNLGGERWGAHSPTMGEKVVRYTIGKKGKAVPWKKR